MQAAALGSDMLSNVENFCATVLKHSKKKLMVKSSDSCSNVYTGKFRLVNIMSHPCCENGIRLNVYEKPAVSLTSLISHFYNMGNEFISPHQL